MGGHIDVRVIGEHQPARAGQVDGGFYDLVRFPRSLEATTPVPEPAEGRSHEGARLDRYWFYAGASEALPQIGGGQHGGIVVFDRLAARRYPLQHVDDLL